jgi:hypothetical protein
MKIDEIYHENKCILCNEIKVHHIETAFKKFVHKK